MKFRILSAILRSPWAIDEQFAIAHGGVIAGLLNGYEIEESGLNGEEPANSVPFAISASSRSSKYSLYDEAPSGSIAVIPVRGALMKEDQDCGPVGMDTLGERVIEADSHKNIDSIILLIDTPGGSVEGLKAFADKIKATQKPVVAYVEESMASAGVWIGSSADHIIAQNTTTRVGCLGTMWAFHDMQPLWEAKGVKFHRIISDQTPDKNKDFIDALAGEYENVKENYINPLAQFFIDAVKANRPQADESVFTGKMFFAEEALTLGLIDEIGSLDAAIQKAISLSDERKATSKKVTSTSNSIKQTPKMKQLAILTALLAVTALESTDDGVFLNEQQLEAIEDRLAADADALQAANQATETVDTLNERISALEADLAEARQLPAAETAVTVVATDNIDTKEDINAKLESLPMSERIAILSKE